MSDNQTDLLKVYENTTIGSEPLDFGIIVQEGTVTQ